MRYLVGFVFVLALVASPLGVSAQAGEEGTAAEPNLVEEPAPSSEPTPEEPALELKLDAAGVEVAPSPPRTADGYTLARMELRVKQSRRRLIGSAVILGLGAACAAGAVVASRNFADDEPTLSDPLFSGAAIFAGTCAFLRGIGVIVGMDVSGSKMADRKQERRRLQEAEHGTTRRVQWDLETARLVF
jgi:hypothetical protein